MISGSSPHSSSIHFLSNVFSFFRVKGINKQTSQQPNKDSHYSFSVSVIILVPIDIPIVHTFPYECYP